VFKIDEHMGMAISGLIADARVLTKYLRNECLSHKYTYESSMPVQRLSIQLADKSQVFTQKAEKRPYGVGMLIIGYDKTGAQLFQNVPSGNYFSYHAQAMGARSQSARTYLEKHYESFADEQSLDALIDHALNALKTTLAGDDKMNVENVSLAVVGKGMAFKHYSPDDIRPFVERAAADDDDAATAMEE
jgi:20S proteasome subunit alpha 6